MEYEIFFIFIFLSWALPYHRSILYCFFSSFFFSLQKKWQRPKQTAFLLTTFLFYTLLLGQQLTWQQPHHLARLPHHLWPVRCALDLELLGPISLCHVAWVTCSSHWVTRLTWTWPIQVPFWLSQLDGLKVISLKLNLLSGPIPDLSPLRAKTYLSLLQQSFGANFSHNLLSKPAVLAWPLSQPLWFSSSFS